VRLLLDQNLAPGLVRRLADLYPGGAHVRDLGLASADDLVVWEYAKIGGFTIVSKDGDFRQLSFVRGGPPKVIWLRVGNRTTAELEAILRDEAAAVAAFDADPTAALLVVTA
jgi:predicted nuclease of predicted toxin-antitoxin system